MSRRSRPGPQPTRRRPGPRQRDAEAGKFQARVLDQAPRRTIEFLKLGVMIHLVGN